MERLSTRPAVDDLEKRQLHAELQAKMFGGKTRIELGPYVLTERLGSGAMGIVYVAEDPRLQREVAIKVLHPQRRLDNPEGGHRRLRREAQALSRVTHPNVIEVYDVGLADDRVFIAMELVRGLSLDAWLSASDRSWRSILEQFVQAGRGLAAAHQAGVVHRDFKPSNVLVGEDGRVRVLDFGLAKAQRRPTPAEEETYAETVGDEQATADGALVGTPRYMAPRQLLGASADASSDQYAFCVALFEALFRELPFDPNAMLRSKQKADRRGPQLRSGPPFSIQRAIARGLSPDPGDRFDSMDELLAALDIGSRRRRRVTGLAVAGTAAVVAGLMVWIARDRPSPVPTRAAPSYGQGAPTPAQEAVAAELHAEFDAVNSLVKEQRLEEADVRSASALDRSRTTGSGSLLAEAGLVRGTVLTEADRMDAAREVLLAAHDDAVASGEARVQAKVSIALAQIEIQRFGDLEAGQRWVRDASALRDRLEGDRWLEYKLGQLEVAAAHGLGDLPEAAAAARRAVDHARVAWGERHFNVAHALQALGTVLFEQHQFAEARTAIEEAIEIARDSGREDDVLVPHCLSMLAGIDSMQAALTGRDPALFEQAIANSRRAASAFEAVRGPDHYDTINARLTLGIVLAEAGASVEARRELEHAMAEFERIVGPSDPGVAVAAENLGLVQFADGDLEGAQASLQRSVIVMQSARGNDYPSLATTLNHLGDVQRRRGFLDQARNTYERALELAAAGGPSRRAATLDGLGRVEGDAGNGVRAAQLFEASAEAWAEAVGPDAEQVQAARESAAAEREKAAQ